MSKHADIDATEAYAFLKVVAPKLEQLRRRLVVAKDLLKAGDPEKARIDAIVESQLAIKDFLTGIPDMGALVEPIDVLLAAVRDEAGEPEAFEPEAPELPAVEIAVAEEALPEPAIAEPEKPEPEPQPAAPVKRGARRDAADDAWLQVGTAIVVEKLASSGMTPASAEAYLEQVYKTIGLASPDGYPITVDTIKAWRANVVGPGTTGWRRNRLLKGRGAKGPAAFAEAKARVDEIAVMFRKMAPWMVRGKR